VEAQELASIIKAIPAMKHRQMPAFFGTNLKSGTNLNVPTFFAGPIDLVLNILFITIFYPDQRHNATGLSLGFHFGQKKSPLTTAGF
jgi:hypothetical protein